MKSEILSRLGCLFLTVALAWPAQVEAYPFHRRLFRETYKKSVRCELCHGSGGGTERNAYGRDWQKFSETAASFKRVESLDSDGDGISNIEEINRGSNPGNARSTPSRPGRRWKQVQQIPVPVEQLKLVLGKVDSMQAIEPDLTHDSIAYVESKTGRKLGLDLRYPTLYFGVKDSKRVAVAMFAHFNLAKAAFSFLVGIGLNGKVLKIAMFRAGEQVGSVFMPYLWCLQGHGKRTIPEPGDAGCPKIPGQELAQKRIAETVRQVLWTCAALFKKKR
jgi:hypothetical protein